jgi:hypothetical protein
VNSSSGLGDGPPEPSCVQGGLICTTTLTFDAEGHTFQLHITLSDSSPIQPVSWVPFHDGFDPAAASFGIEFSLGDPGDPSMAFSLMEDGSLLSFELAAVPAPVAGAGLPGVVAACGGLLAWLRRRRKAA